MTKHLSSFSPTFLLRACLILVTICPLLRIHTLKKVARSFAHAPGAPDYQFHVARRSDSTLSYGGDDPVSSGTREAFTRRQLGTSQRVSPCSSMFYLNSSPCSPESKHGYQHSRISNAASAIGIESNSTRLSSRDRIDGYVSYPYQGALSSLPLNAPLPSSASLNFCVTFCSTGRYIKHCIHYHKTLDFLKLCKIHAYSIQVDQGERTACKNRTFISAPSTASSLYPVSHPVTNIDFNQ
ncbi:hypothetical protein DFH08DRAFT_809811 [Mycena albidolilacea]|uniref:Uncharacterized protein n=1 Tax=Mycena albidolilacea TaxID=1033008 RepID=A0AAD7A0M9_9AGAR|nr:hypothetical protein DFH08DRAFT_809811 [Mycena albidolilacea]